MGETEKDIVILFENHQWMVQLDHGLPYIVQVKKLQCADDEDDEELIAEAKREALEGGYWIRVSDLRYVTEGHNIIRHVCEKRWVEISAFEQAVKFAISHFGVKPNYDVDAEFRLAGQEKRRYAA